ncbi:MAG: twin-arginine translocase TatA/TatE family subunit [Pseudomonadota bacterium]
MFGLGMMEILMILAIALIVVGPKKLPELAKTLGRAMGEFKRSAQDLKRSMDVESTVKDIVDLPETNLKEILNDPPKGIQNDFENKATPKRSDANPYPDQGPFSFEKETSPESNIAPEDNNSDDTDMDNTDSHTAESGNQEPEPDIAEANDDEPHDKPNNTRSETIEPTQ